MMLCPRGHELKPFRSVIVEPRGEHQARTERPGTEMEWWAHVDGNEIHVLPQGEDFDELLALEEDA